MIATYECKKIRKIFTGPVLKLVQSFVVISDVYSHLLHTKLQVPFYSVDFKSHIHIWQVSPQLSCGDTRQI